MAYKKLRYTPDYLMCPECFEKLTREDIEGFSRCPYCNKRLEPEKELEEFLLQPVIEHWLRQSRDQQPEFFDK